MNQLRQPDRCPQFNPWRGFATVTSPPPFAFPGTTIRYFPLQADAQKLQRFCDNYLNVAREFVVFRPLAPMVMLCIADYGRMSQVIGNLGWTSQNELFFAVPVRWYQRQRDGKLKFCGFAQNAPFIYVDNESSQVEGREVFGWPKVQGFFDQGSELLSHHPRANRQVLSMSANIFGELYRNERPYPRELISIQELAQPSLSTLPPRPGAANGPIMTLARNSAEWLDLMMRALTATFGPLWGGPGMDELESALETVPGILSNLQQMTQSISANTINLKQFRDAEQPGQICYQALTNAQVQITRIREAGLLGEAAMLAGDPSGGFRVNVHRYDELPIIETLGLEVEEHSVDSRVATLKPLMPFWQEMDLLYQKGQRLCWRTHQEYWRDDRRIARRRRDQPDYAAYNTTGSAAFQLASGPFLFPETRFRVLPLLAEAGPLRRFCDSYLNLGVSDQTGCRYEPWGNYVYLVVMAFDQMASATNNMGRWARTEVDFFVPVRCYDADDRLLTTGVISPFMYSDSDIRITTGREVNGWPMLKSRITTPTNPWLARDEKTRSDVGQLALEIEAVSAINTGQQTTWHRLLEVVQGFSPNRSSDWDSIRAGWGERIKSSLLEMEALKNANADEFERMRALSLEVIARREPINQISLKQFRNAGDAGEACYQAHVSSGTIIQDIQDVREIEQPIHVRIHRVATQPIVETLGLLAKYQEVDDSGIVDVLEASRPFYMRADLETRDGRVLCERSESMRWNPREKVEATAQAQQHYFELTEPVRLRKSLARKIDDQPDSVSALARASMDERARDRYREAAASKVEPQMLVSTMLSREWNDHGLPRSKRVRIDGIESQKSEESPPQFPDFVLRYDSLGLTLEQTRDDPEFVITNGNFQVYWSAQKALEK